MLCKSPEERPDAIDVLDHAWLSGVSNPASLLPGDAEVTAAVAHELVDMGLAGADGSMNVPRSKQQLVRTLLTLRARRELSLAHEVPGVSTAASSPAPRRASCSESSDEDDDSVVPHCTPSTAASPTFSPLSPTFAGDAAAASRAPMHAADPMLLHSDSAFGARKRDLSECEEDAELPEPDEDQPQAPLSPSRPITPANLAAGPGATVSPAKRARVSPSPPPTDDMGGPADPAPAQFV
jgi:hypothetical protein